MNESNESFEKAPETCPPRSQRVALRMIRISELYKDPTWVGKEVLVGGLVRSVRKSKGPGFLIIHDGSDQREFQCVFDEGLSNSAEVAALLTGSSVRVRGTLKESEGKGQSVELLASEVHIYSATDTTYPLQKKGTSLEFLREKAHLRARTNTIGAAMRLRHRVSLAVHDFFDSEGFFYLHTPIITAYDAEGAGDMFNVTTLDLQNIPKDKSGAVDYSRDYFKRKTSLAVTGQLEGEAYALSLGKIYTFGPTFRSENSNTSRHLSEFWMVEPEVAFYELEDNAALASRFVRHLISEALYKCSREMEFFEWRYQQEHKKQGKDADLLARLNHIVESEFELITYTEAIALLKDAKAKFDFSPEWGAELQSEHERFLCEEYFKGPVIVTDYPKQCKAFYMKANADGKTVRAMDVLVPGVGEIIGGSERECDLTLLETRMDELKMDKSPLWWYLELRKYGSVPHSGFGLGLERILMYISGLANIRDVIPFPRFPGHAEF